MAMVLNTGWLCTHSNIDFLNQKKKDCSFKNIPTSTGTTTPLGICKAEEVGICYIPAFTLHYTTDANQKTKECHLLILPNTFCNFNMDSFIFNF